MRKDTILDWVLVGLFAALTWVGAYIRVPLLPDVPLTLQTLIVVLGGLILGPWRGALSQMVYVTMGLIGLPVFSQGALGLGYLVVPTFGFTLGFILGAATCGWVGILLNARNSMVRSIIAALAGMIGVYLLGLPYLYFVRVLIGKAVPFNLLVISMFPFAIADVIKSVAVGLFSPGIARALPKL